MRLFASATGLLAILSVLNTATAAPTNSGFEISWEEAYAKAEKLVSGWTLEQKVNVGTGSGNEQGPCEGNTIASPGFPALCMNDGPTGLRRAYNSSQFVAGINCGASFDRELTRQRGAYMAQEFRDKGVNVMLGPGMNMLRVPRGGRNWEFAGEDPYLAAAVSEELIHGIQSEGVIATTKHLIGNEQEENRYDVDTIMDDKTLHEMYLIPFYHSIEAGSGAVMCSYNKVNGTYACDSDNLMNNILKDQLDFKGFVMSDWWATHSTVNGINSGLDMTMPGDANADSVTGGGLWFGKNLTDAVERGDVSEDRVTDMATRIVAAWYKVYIDYPELRFNYFDSDVHADLNVQRNHKENIRAQGAASVVLLKNEDNILPLKQDSINKLAIIGSDAGPDPEGLNKCQDGSCSRGTLTQGWGSGSCYLPYLVTPLDGITDRADDSIEITSTLDDWDLENAAKIAADADIAFVFAKSDSGEMYIVVDDNPGDRNNLTLWYNGENLIKAVADANDNTVVVIHSVGPIDMSSWIDHPNIKAIVWPGLPGQETGNSLADVLFGDYNPSGRLPYTIAKDINDYVADVSPDLEVEYTEGVYIGYRHFDKYNIEPLYEFGYGLSYTTFEFDKLNVKVNKKKTEKVTATLATASLFVENTGHLDGNEIVQAYIVYPESADQPPKQLRGFEKVFVEAGKKKKVNFEFTVRDLSIWDVVQQKWVVPSGEFTLLAGHTSLDIRQKATFTV
ncbi:glycoside hydrolase superfamily [Phascolomyces articulosus]|uniref:beta-glucosidase n=1 Tax=Phascolomyces articulosus TaxID=60185 RepID=A0AAD5KH02_9FUNG|nr:glycoside hydrolase superfamily [Phascolomyces articulosus]